MLVKRFLKNKLALLGLGIVMGMLFIAMFSGYISTHDPLKISISNRIQPPSAEHIFGTDHFGRDIWSRVLSGTEISIQVGIYSIAIGAFFGIIIGLIGGYFGGWIDYCLVLIMDAIIAFPSTILAIGIMAVMGQGLFNVIIAIAIPEIPLFGRIVRAAVLSIREKEYVEAARALGSSHFKTILLHILPNAMAPLIVVTTLGVATAILIEAALSFLGLGVPAPAPSWGNILSDGRNFITQAPWIIIFPGVAISITVLGFNTLGDGLRDVLDPRLKQ